MELIDHPRIGPDVVTDLQTSQQASKSFFPLVPLCTFVYVPGSVQLMSIIAEQGQTHTAVGPELGTFGIF